MSDRAVQEVLQVLDAANPSHGNHRAALQRISEMQQQPDFFAACATIFSNPASSSYHRLQAAFQIKNNILNPMCINQPIVRERIVLTIADGDNSVRKTACSVISAAVRNNAWDVSDVVPQLVQAIHAAGTSNVAQTQGAVLALSHITEDCVQLLDLRNLSDSVVGALCPCVLYEGNEKVRLHALNALAVFLEQAGVDNTSRSYIALRNVILPLINALFQNLQSPMSPAIAEKSVSCMVFSLTYYDLISQDLFIQMAKLMLQACQVDPNAQETLRLSATEFWRAVLHFPDFAEICLPVMPEIIPILVDSMIYSELELGILQANANDASVPDKPEDIKPRHYKAKTFETNEEDEDDDDDEVEEWNLRRVAALTLDDIAEYYGDRILMHVLSVIDKKMQPSNDWRPLEAAVLALGAVSEGCAVGLRDYLSQIVDRLLEILEMQGTHFLVVNITTWAVRRQASFILSTPDPATGRLALLDRFMTCLAGGMKSHSKLIQEAATSALTDLCQQADDGQLVPYLDGIAATVNVCLRGYQLKNRLLLFELVEALCELFGTKIGEGANLNLFIDPLVEIWQQTPDDSPLLFGFFTCMSAVCAALGPGIQPMAQEIFSRAYRVLESNMGARIAAIQAQQDPPENEFIVTSAALLSGLFDALGSSLEPLVAMQPKFIDVLLAIVMDEEAAVRQSGFALFGDLAQACPLRVQAVLPQYLAALMSNLSEVTVSTSGVVSNATWSLSTLLHHQMDIANTPTLNLATLTPVLATLLRILTTSPFSAEMRNMAENLCLCIGTILHAEPTVLQGVGATINMFVQPWLENARGIKNIPQRDDAVRGLLLAVQGNVACLLPCMTLFFDFCLNLKDAPMDLRKAATTLLQSLRTNGPQQWATALGRYGDVPRQQLFTLYGVN